MAERYKILDQLGAGGAGAVFKAYDTQLNRYVAIKRLLTKEQVEQEDTQSGGLRQEAASLATLQHPNIVSIFDLANDDEGFFIVMELLEGETLGDWIRNGVLGLQEFYEMATQTLEAILTAHHQNILHRDLKPENIKMQRLPGGRLQVKVLDFGLARMSYGARKMTEDQSGNILGSIYYMAPEQFLRRPVDGRTDLYSLGCLFYQLLSGRRPFDDSTLQGIMERHLQHQVHSLHEIAAHVPGPVCDWVMWLMNLEPAHRPNNAQHALSSLREIHQAGWFNPQPVSVLPVAAAIPETATAPLRRTTAQAPTRTTGTQPMRRPTAAIPQAAAPPGFARTPTGALVPVGGPPPVRAVAPPPPEPARKAGIPVWIWPVAAVAVLGGAWLFWPKKTTPTPVAATPSVAPIAKPTVSNEAKPWIRPANLVLPGAVLHYVSTDRKEFLPGQSGKTGDQILKWHDLQGKGGTGSLVSYDNLADNCPVYIQEKDDAFRFYPNFVRFGPGQGMMHGLDKSNPASADYPFGANTPGKGLTLFLLVRPQITDKELNCLTMSDPDRKTILSIRAYDNNEFKAVILVGSTRVEAKVGGRNTKQFNLVSLIWNATTNKLLFTVRTQDGNKGRTETDAPKGTDWPVLNKIYLSKNRRDDFKPQDFFTGDILELGIWPYPMTWEDRNLQDWQYSQFYFKNAGSRY